MTDKEIQEEYKGLRKACKKEKMYKEFKKSEHYLAWAIIVAFSHKRGVFDGVNDSPLNVTGMVLKAIDKGLETK